MASVFFRFLVTVSKYWDVVCISTATFYSLIFWFLFFSPPRNTDSSFCLFLSGQSGKVFFFFWLLAIPWCPLIQCNWSPPRAPPSTVNAIPSAFTVCTLQSNRSLPPVKFITSVLSRSLLIDFRIMRPQSVPYWTLFNLIYFLASLPQRINKTKTSRPSWANPKWTTFRTLHSKYNFQTQTFFFLTISPTLAYSYIY